MFSIWIYIFTSVLVVSLLSLTGAIFFVVNSDKLKRILIHSIGFSAGAILGDVFIHILPDLIQNNEFNFLVSLTILSGILFGFVTEKIICWRHCHTPVSSTHIHKFVYMNMFGDVVHNFIDGLVIATSYLVSIEIGIATTLAIMFHEIPHEIGNFGILISGGFTRKKALVYNFLTAIVSFAGAIFAMLFTSAFQNALPFLLAFAAGNFIYIAGSDLIPELHKDEDVHRGIVQFFFILCGIFVMLGFLVLGK